MPALAEIALLVDPRCVRPSGLVDVPHRLEHLIVDMYKLFRCLQRIPVFRNDQTDCVSNHPRRVALGDHDVPVLLDVADLVVRHVRRRQNADHARNLPGFRQVNLSDNRSRVCRPDARRIGHGGRIKAIDIAPVFCRSVIDTAVPARQGGPHPAPLRLLRLAELTASPAVRDILLETVGAVKILPDVLNLDIIRVLAGSKHLLAHVNAEGSGPDTPVILLFRIVVDLLHAPEHLSRETDTLDDLPVSGTAAEVAADRRLDFLIRRIRVLPEQPDCADDHSRRAEAALDGAADPERIDKCFLLEVCQPLHCDDFLPGSSLRLQNAGSRRFPVHQNHAGPAGALTAPILDRMKMKFVPKKTEHRRLFRCRYTFSIHRECILLSHVGSFLPIHKSTLLHYFVSRRNSGHGMTGRSEKSKPVMILYCSVTLPYALRRPEQADSCDSG